MLAISFDPNPAFFYLIGSGLEMKEAGICRGFWLSDLGGFMIWTICLCPSESTVVLTFFVLSKSEGSSYFILIEDLLPIFSANSLFRSSFSTAVTIWSKLSCPI